MLLLLALISTIAFALNGLLVGHYSKKIDLFAVAAIRSLSLAFVLLPMLLLGDLFTLPVILLEHWHLLGAAIVMGALGQWIFLISVRYLPLGILMVIFRGFLIIFSLWLGFWWLSDELSLWQWYWLGLLLVGLALLTPLSKKKTKSPPLSLKLYALGVLLVAVESFFIVAAITLITMIARETDPFVASYLWEVGIGILSFGVFLARGWFKPKTLRELTVKNTVKISLAASPTLFGTSCFFLASTQGPLALVNAVGALGIPFSLVFSWWAYQESITRHQILAAIIMTLSIAGLYWQ